MKHLRGLRRARWESADPALAAPGSYGIPERDATRRARIVLLWRALLLRWSAERDLSIMGVIWERLLRLRRNQERYRWYALGVTTFTQAAASAVTSALGPIAPLIMAEFAISRAQVGLVQTSIYLSGTWSAMVGGRIADRAGERSALIVSGVITGAAALASGLVGPFWAFLSVAFIMGLGTGVQNPAGSAAVMRWFPPRRRAFAMGIRQTGVPVGGVLAATVWVWAATAWGWRAAYELAGAMALVGTALIAATYFDPPREGEGGTAAVRP